MGTQLSQILGVKVFVEERNFLRGWKNSSQVVSMKMLPPHRSFDVIFFGLHGIFCYEKK